MQISRKNKTERVTSLIIIDNELTEFELKKIAGGVHTDFIHHLNQTDVALTESEWKYVPVRRFAR